MPLRFPARVHAFQKHRERWREGQLGQDRKPDTFASYKHNEAAVGQVTNFAHAPLLCVSDRYTSPRAIIRSFAVYPA